METKEGKQEDLKFRSHDEVLDEIGGYSWLALFATMILIPAKVSGDLIVNIGAFYQLLPDYEC